MIYTMNKAEALSLLLGKEDKYDYKIVDGLLKPLVTRLFDTML